MRLTTLLGKFKRVLMDDNQELVSFVDEQDDNEATTLVNSNKQLASLLKSLQKPWATQGYDTAEPIQGWLWKKKRLTFGWKRSWAALVGNTIYFYRSREVPTVPLSSEFAVQKTVFKLRNLLFIRKD